MSIRSRLIAAAALTPMIAAGISGLAQAETKISGAPPFATSKVNDDLKVEAGTTITATTSGPIVTLDTTGKQINNEGTLTASEVDNVTGMLGKTDITGFVRNSGTISLIDDFERKDDDSDGDPDGVFAEGTGRIGMHIEGGGTFTGAGAPLVTGGAPIALLNALGGSIRIDGNKSTGILVESDITGTIASLGAVTVTGDNSAGINITGDVSGDVRTGAVTVRGVGSTGVTIDGDVGGKLTLNGAVSTSGYSFQQRPVESFIKNLDKDDTGQNGVAFAVSGSVTGGILLSTAPTDADTKNADEDNDGIPDASQGTGTIASFGSAAALQIGSGAKDTNIGNVGATADTAYGIVSNGQILANGILDNVDALAVDLGVAGGKTVNLNGGLNVVSATGTIQANAFEANATAIDVGAGVTMTEIRNAGIISGTVTTTNAADIAQGINIAAGGSVTTITNTGTIAGGVTGLTGEARAITDNGGKLTSITNTGAIVAAVTPAQGVTGTNTGKTIAIDASTSTADLAVTQSQSTVKDAAAPVLRGAILFGSGANALTVSAGSVTGDIGFGAGKDSLTISGDTTSVTGALRDDAAGELTIAVNSGKLAVSNAEVIKATSVTLGAKSALVVTADTTVKNTDPENTVAVTRLDVVDATITGGAQIGLNLRGLITDPVRLTVISASGTMTASGPLGDTLLENAPFLYNVKSSVDTKAREVYLDVVRRTTAELGFNASEAAAYDAVFGAMSVDTGIRDALLSATTQQGLTALYDQLLPDTGEGVFSAIDATMISVSALVGDRPDPEQRIGGDSLWLQEVNQRVVRETNATLGSEAKVFGVVGGYESMSGRGGAIGFTLGFYNVQDDDDAAAVGEHVVANVLEGGAYWRWTPGNFRFIARGAGGFAWFDSTRRFVTPGVVREATSDWTGAFATGHLGAGYELRLGRYFVRPEISGDYLYVREEARTETGGGDGFNLAVDERTSDRLSAAGIVTVGAQFGRTSWVRPEIRVGYRMIASGIVGDTTARFINAPGGPFTIVADDDSGGWAVVGFSIKGGTELSYAALEGDAEIRDGEQRYNVRIAGRAMF